MSTTGQSEAAQSSRKRGSSECLPLIDAATKDLFRKNAFRITGLPVDATTREVAKHADKIKMFAEFGQDPHTAGAAFAIKPPPTLDDIREAIQKLKDPEKRLIDEFFWFWPEEFGTKPIRSSDSGFGKGRCPKLPLRFGPLKKNLPRMVLWPLITWRWCIISSALDWENYSR